MITLAALLLSLGGFAFLALSMRKHHRQVLVAEPTNVSTFVLRNAAWLLLGLSLAASILGEGTSVGVVLWTGILALSALAVTMLLAYWPRVVAALAFTAPLLALVLYGLASAAPLDGTAN